MFSVVIPLRAGSKGLAKKNIFPLNGVPLYQHTLEQALSIKPRAIYISTDIEEVLEKDFPAPVRLVERPKDLAGDEVPIEHVLLDLFNKAKIKGTVVLLQATSPLRSIEDISSAVECFSKSEYGLVMSITKADSTVLKWGTLHGDRFQVLAEPEFCFANRQSLPSVFKPTGAVYVFDAERFVRNRGFCCNRIGAVLMPPERSIDIDALADIRKCEIEIRKNASLLGS